MTKADTAKYRRRRALLALGVIVVLVAIAVAWAGITLYPSVPEDGSHVTGTRKGADIYERRLSDRALPDLSGIDDTFDTHDRQTWRICSPGCGPVVGRGEFFEAKSMPVGGRVALVTSLHGKLSVAETPIWRGPVRNVKPPTFRGSPRIGSTLVPHHGTWSGGWSDDYTLVGMRACRTRAAVDCRALTASSFQPTNPERVKLDSAYAGWYVGAIETLVSAGEAFTMPGYPTGGAGQISPTRSPTPSATVAAGALEGPVPPQ